MDTIRRLSVLIVLAAACSPSGNDDDDTVPSDDDDDDTASDDDDDDTTDDDDDTTAEPWSPEQNVSTEAQSNPRGWQYAKGIVHLHTPYSHDACDGEGLIEGEPDPECLTHLREALCTVKLDYAMFTDHPSFMRGFEFQDLFHHQDDDTWVLEGDNPIASLRHCPDGHDVVLTVGWEDELMPTMLEDHAAAEVTERERLYDQESPETIEAIRNVNGLVTIAHSESRSLERLRAIRPDGMEIYNLHANIDPSIRPDWLGLEPFGYLDAAAPFLNPQEFPDLHPDLVFLSFFDENRPSLEKWETLINEQPITAHAGTDAHENSLPMPMADGERVDSYRRMMKWFSNWLLVTERTPAAIKEAFRSGRNLIVYEILGVPVGFDFVAEEAEGQKAEMGQTVAPGAMLTVTRPTVYSLDSTAEAPVITLRLYHIAMDGTRTLVATSDGDLAQVADQPGAYRAEAHIVPNHLRGWLSGLDTLVQSFVWIYTNPIYVR